MHYLLNLERFKIYIKIHTKYRSYTFRSTTIIRQLVLNLAKVLFILKHPVQLRRYKLFGDVAACHRAECLLCAVQNGTGECVLCAVQNGTGECVLCAVQNGTGECVLCAVQNATASARCHDKKNHNNFLYPKFIYNWLL
jgi:hypothetical protein